MLSLFIYLFFLFFITIFIIVSISTIFRVVPNTSLIFDIFLMPRTWWSVSRAQALTTLSTSKYHETDGFKGSVHIYYVSQILGGSLIREDDNT